LDGSVLSSLEFGDILGLLRLQTVTPMGARLATALRPAGEPAQVLAANSRTAEAARYLGQRGSLPFGTIVDPDPALAHLDVEGSVLAPLEILDLLSVLKAGRLVKMTLNEARGDCPRLWAETRDLPELGNLVRFLDGKIAPTGEFEDQASDDLRGLRQDLRRQGERLAVLLTAIRERPEVARALQDDFVSLRSERHVIPVRAEARGAIPGIVHGISGSGATVYMEPIETVEINNEIVTLRDREAEEVRRLLVEYTGLLRSRRAEIRIALEVVGRLDLAMAQARLAQVMRARPAALSADGSLRLAAARHPLVEATLGSRHRKVVPLDLSLPAGSRVIVLSGPNTGGKTVALKTVGLCSLMFQSGLSVPAEEAVLPVFNEVFIDIGDRQSIVDGLSTFSGRIETVAEIARRLAPPALILMDEVGTGTDPEDGVALAIAVLEHFRERGAMVIATTHLEPLKAYAATTPQCLNAAMQFDEETASPTFRLVAGLPGRSGALEIAERLGLPRAILDAARARRGEAAGRITLYLQTLEEMTLDLRTRLAAAAAEQTRLRDEQRRAEEELNRRSQQQKQAIAAEIELALASLRAEGERYLSSLPDREIQVRMRREEARAAARLRAEARRLVRATTVSDQPRPLERAPLKIGELVDLEELGQRGTVAALSGDRVIVLVRGKRVTVARENCRPAAADPSQGPVLPRGVRLERRPQGAPVDELHLRGMRVEEALEQVDKFLDDASLGGLSPVRLVHGVGSGRLMEAIRDLLSRHPQVEGYAIAPADEGGRGVTVVRLKI